jgi:hypothetical protein
VFGLCAEKAEVKNETLVIKKKGGVLAITSQVKAQIMPSSTQSSLIVFSMFMAERRSYLRDSP